MFQLFCKVALLLKAGSGQHSKAQNKQSQQITSTKKEYAQLRLIKKSPKKRSKLLVFNMLMA
jgi:hypothetical protein